MEDEEIMEERTTEENLRAVVGITDSQPRPHSAPSSVPSEHAPLFPRDLLRVTGSKNFHKRHWVYLFDNLNR